MNLDVTKPVQTRDGCKARIVDTNYRNGGGYTVLAIIEKNGVEYAYSFKSDGTFGNNPDDPLNLVNIPERFRGTFCVNIYSSEPPAIHRSKAAADFLSGSGRVACVEFGYDVEEGQGL